MFCGNVPSAIEKECQAKYSRSATDMIENIAPKSQFPYKLKTERAKSGNVVPQMNPALLPVLPNRKLLFGGLSDPSKLSLSRVRLYREDVALLQQMGSQHDKAFHSIDFSLTCPSCPYMFLPYLVSLFYSISKLSCRGARIGCFVAYTLATPILFVGDLLGLIFRWIFPGIWFVVGCDAGCRRIRKTTNCCYTFFAMGGFYGGVNHPHFSVRALRVIYAHYLTMTDEQFFAVSLARADYDKKIIPNPLFWIAAAFPVLLFPALTAPTIACDNALLTTMLDWEEFLGLKGLPYDWKEPISHFTADAKQPWVEAPNQLSMGYNPSHNSGENAV
eukprot:ANDGO_06869.mRNA.1 hypothetical protein